MKKWAVAGIASALLWIQPVIADVKIIVNAANRVDNITITQLRAFYKGNAKLWDDGTKVVPIDLDDGHPNAAHFSDTVLNLTIEKKQKMWVKKIFMGEGVPPDQVKNDADVIRYITNEKGGIGYISADTPIKPTVKVISIDHSKQF